MCIISDEPHGLGKVLVPQFESWDSRPSHSNRWDSPSDPRLWQKPVRQISSEPFSEPKNSMPWRKIRSTGELDSLVGAWRRKAISPLSTEVAHDPDRFRWWSTDVNESIMPTKFYWYYHTTTWVFRCLHASCFLGIQIIQHPLILSESCIYRMVVIHWFQIHKFALPFDFKFATQEINPSAFFALELQRYPLPVLKPQPISSIQKSGCSKKKKRRQAHQITKTHCFCYSQVFWWDSFKSTKVLTIPRETTLQSELFCHSFPVIFTLAMQIAVFGLWTIGRKWMDIMFIVS